MRHRSGSAGEALPLIQIAQITRYRELPIELLIEADWNYKEQDAGLSRKLVENIRRNGQLENIIVRQLVTGFFEVVNGNHRLAAFRELGFEKVIVYDCGTISLVEAQRIAIETNETRFATDQFKLAERMAELEQRFGAKELAETMPYTLDQVEGFKRLVDFDWDGFEQQQSDRSSGEDKSKTLKIAVSDATYELWNQWLETVTSLGATDRVQAFEWAVIAALNVPYQSIT
jgi:hypothetical protein